MIGKNAIGPSSMMLTSPIWMPRMETVRLIRPI